MERRISKAVLLSEITFDEELYPRNGYNWQTGYDYAQSLLAGATFPPITLALYKGKKYLIDGKHRLEAHKLNKQAMIKAEIYSGWSFNKMFEEAIRRNIAHGRVLSPYEKRVIAHKLFKMKYANSKVSSLLNIPENKLEHFVAQRLINSITGKVITETIVKSPLQHKAGTSVSEADRAMIEHVQEGMYSRNQGRILDEIIRLFEEQLIDLTDKNIVSKVAQLKELLQNYNS